MVGEGLAFCSRVFYSFCGGVDYHSEGVNVEGLSELQSQLFNEIVPCTTGHAKGDQSCTIFEKDGRHLGVLQNQWQKDHL